MAETITYRVIFEPRVNTVSSTALSNGSVDEVILSTADVLTLRSLIDELQAGGVDASTKALLTSVAAMLVAGTAAWDETNTLMMASLAAEIANGGISAATKTSLSKIAAMCVANTASYDATNATALADFITAIQAATDVSSVVTAINGL